MSKNLFCLSRQAMTKNINCTAATAGTDSCQQRSAYLRLYLWALQYGRRTGDLNTRAERANHVNVDTGHRAQQGLRLEVKVVELAL